MMLQSAATIKAVNIYLRFQSHQPITAIELYLSVVFCLALRSSLQLVTAVDIECDFSLKRVNGRCEKKVSKTTSL